MSAITLNNPRQRLFWTGVFALLGLAGLVLTVITYEQTPGTTPHFSNALWFVADSLIATATTRAVQILAALAIGFALGWVSKIAIDKRRADVAFKALDWRASYAVVALADPALIEAHKAKIAERDRLSAQLDEVGKAYSKLTAAEPPLGTSERAAEVSALEAKRDPILAEWTKIRDQCDRLFVQMQQSVHDRLRSGELVARGFLMPVMADAETMPIRADQWHFLKLAGQLDEASGKGISYVGVQIAKAQRS